MDTTSGGGVDEAASADILSSDQFQALQALQRAVYDLGRQSTGADIKCVLRAFKALRELPHLEKCLIVRDLCANTGLRHADIMAALRRVS